MDDEDNKFKVSVKAVFTNNEGKYMLIREENGLWEFPGGKVNKNESFILALQRECREELGIPCHVLDEKPIAVYPTVDRADFPRIMVFFRTEFKALNFKNSEEYEEIGFFTKDEIAKLPLYPQLKPFIEYL